MWKKIHTAWGHFWGKATIVKYSIRKFYEQEKGPLIKLGGILILGILQTLEEREVNKILLTMKGGGLPWLA